MDTTVLVAANANPVVVPGPAQAAAAAASAAAARAWKELAEAAALSLANVFADTTAGLAATAENGTFWVFDAGLLKLYREVGGVAVLLDSLPLSTAVLAQRAFGSTAAQGVDTWLNGGAIGADIGVLYAGHNTVSADAITLDAAGNWPPGHTTRRSLGTLAAPTPVTAGTQLGYWDWRGYNTDGGGGYFFNAASLDVKVSSAIAFGDGDAPPTEMGFYICWDLANALNVASFIPYGPTDGAGFWVGWKGVGGAESLQPSGGSKPRRFVVTKLNDWTDMIDARPASGNAFGQRIDINKTTASDIAQAIYANGALVQATRGDGVSQFVKARFGTGSASALGDSVQHAYTTANDWAATIEARPASGAGFGQRIHTLGTTSADYVLALSSGVGTGAFVWSARGNGDVYQEGDLYVRSVKALGDQAPVADATTARTAALGDAGRYIRFSNGSAVTFTIPPNSDVAFPIGTVIEFEQAGAGAVTVAAGAGVTLNSRGADLTLAGQYAVGGVKKVATDTWTVWGDL